MNGPLTGIPSHGVPDKGPGQTALRWHSETRASNRANGERHRHVRLRGLQMPCRGDERTALPRQVACCVDVEAATLSYTVKARMTCRLYLLVGCVEGSGVTPTYIAQRRVPHGTNQTGRGVRIRATAPRRAHRQSALQHHSRGSVPGRDGHTNRFGND